LTSVARWGDSFKSEGVYTFIDNVDMNYNIGGPFGVPFGMANHYKSDTCSFILVYHYLRQKHSWCAILNAYK
jgi:hypothetical protein